VQKRSKKLLLGFGGFDAVNLGIFVLSRTSEKRVKRGIGRVHRKIKRVWL
jgi:hypothetical protein